MESTPEQSADGMAIVRVLAAVLERLVGANTPLARADPGQVTKFHALKAPGIGILQYLERIHKYSSCSTECFILALVYIDRLIQRNNFLLTELNVHRVVITSILLAAKFFDDAYYNNAYYAKVGGVLVSEMNSLEVEFLFRINFSLHVSPELYSKYHAELISHAIGTSAVAGISSLALGSHAPMTGVLTNNVTSMPEQPQQPMRDLHKAIATISTAQCSRTSCSTDYSDAQQQSDNRFIAAAIPVQITPSPPQTASAAPPPGSYAPVIMQQYSQMQDPLNGDDVGKLIQQHPSRYENRDLHTSHTFASTGYPDSLVHHLHEEKQQFVACAVHRLSLPFDVPATKNGVQTMYPISSSGTISSSGSCPSLINGTNYTNTHANHSFNYGSHLTSAEAQQHYPCRTRTSVVAGCSGI